MIEKGKENRRGCHSLPGKKDPLRKPRGERKEGGDTRGDQPIAPSAAKKKKKGESTAPSEERGGDFSVYSAKRKSKSPISTILADGETGATSFSRRRKEEEKKQSMAQILLRCRGEGEGGKKSVVRR